MRIINAECKGIIFTNRPTELPVETYFEDNTYKRIHIQFTLPSVYAEKSLRIILTNESPSFMITFINGDFSIATGNTS